ncbi:MAG: CoA-binding protein [Mariniphaga sp.]
MTANIKTTLVIGASPKPERYSYAAVKLLQQYGHPVIPLAKRAGFVNGIPVRTDFPLQEQIHTVTLYVGPRHQSEYYDLLLKLKPERVIFNPGTFNDELRQLLENNGIETVEDCTLIMLRSGEF